MRLIVIAALICACATAPGTTEQKIVDCASSVAKEKSAAIMTLVVDILEHGTSWEDDLFQLGSALGADGVAIVKCVVMQYLARPAASPVENEGRVRATQWLHDHGG